MSTKNRRSRELSVTLNNNLPVLHTDGLEIYSRDDKVFFIRFLVNTPAGVIEQCRFMVDQETLNEIIDNLCDSSKYYPDKVTKSKRKTTN